MLKSDSSDGVFGFSQSTLSSTVMEGSNVTLLVDRSVGTFGSVMVYWEVRQTINGLEGAIAITDFLPSSGVVNFSPGETQKVILVLVLLSWSDTTLFSISTECGINSGG